MKEIGSSAFEGCSSLQEITIPITVKSIGGSAFDKCASLTDIYVMGITPVKISGSTFAKSTEKEGTLHVKKSAKSNYENDKQWKKFLNVSTDM